MSDEAAGPTRAAGISIKVKLDDLSLYYRRVALEALGVTFELEPGTFPLKWRAAGLGPMVLADLIPAAEAALGIVKILNGQS